MDKKTQHCQEFRCSKCDLYIQCNTNQNSSKLFYEYQQWLYIGAKTVFSTNGTGTMGHQHAKN